MPLDRRITIKFGDPDSDAGTTDVEVWAERRTALADRANVAVTTIGPLPPAFADQRTTRADYRVRFDARLETEDFISIVNEAGAAYDVAGLVFEDRRRSFVVLNCQRVVRER